MFSMRDLLRTQATNDGLDNEPDGDADDTSVKDALIDRSGVPATGAAPRPIRRSPFGDFVQRERKL